MSELNRYKDVPLDDPPLGPPGDDRINDPQHNPDESELEPIEEEAKDEEK